VLDVVAVRKVGHPWQPEYALGAVTPDGGVYVRGSDGLTDAEVARAVEHARMEAARLDRVLHAEQEPCRLAGGTAVMVDDGLATGATMIAALRWARAGGAARVVGAVPVGAVETLERVRREADNVVCVHPRSPFWAVGLWYASFEQVDDAEVARLLAENRGGALTP
jgi:putative phosphoribosyl transferase